MNTLLHAALLLPTLVPLALQEERGPATMTRLFDSAERDLAASVGELAALREQIAAEKLPLAQELTALEERVTELRREHDAAARAADSGSLEIAALGAELSARRDELDYVGNLLDEYARTFETKVDVSEMQHCGAAVTAAKQAAENETLTMEERLAAQLAFAQVSLARLFELVGGMTFPGVGVDTEGRVAEGTFAIYGPVALFCSSGGAAGGVAGLVVPQLGSDKPLIRPLEGALQAGLATLVETGRGTLPLDPSRGGALKALIQETSLVHIFEKGGPIMWPLLFASVLALGTVLERVAFLLNERRKRDPRALERLFEAVEHGDLDGAARIGRESRFHVARTLGYALEHRDKSLVNALGHAQALEMKRFRRGISILDTVITLAPLLGLLGTVTGMMGSFSLIGGDLGAPGAITGGIAEALIATAFGLGIAITALLPFNVLNTKLDEARQEVESAGTRLELLVHPNAVRAAATNASPAHPAHPRALVGAE